MAETLQINFAETDPWKKKPDELDWLFKVRCFALVKICFDKFEYAPALIRCLFCFCVIRSD